MKANNMPAPTLPVGKIRVLIVNSNESAASALADTLQTKADYEAQTSGSNFETGTISQKFAPHVLLVSLLAEGIDAAGICKSIRTDEDLQTIKIIAIADRLSESESAALLQKGFDGSISNSNDIDEIIKKIEEATAIIY
jgi:DNA-binding NarL/FixJ family response regulator